MAKPRQLFEYKRQNRMKRQKNIVQNYLIKKERKIERKKEMKEGGRKEGRKERRKKGRFEGRK